MVDKKEGNEEHNYWSDDFSLFKNIVFFYFIGFLLKLESPKSKYYEESSNNFVKYVVYWDNLRNCFNDDFSKNVDEFPVESVVVKSLIKKNEVSVESFCAYFLTLYQKKDDTSKWKSEYTKNHKGKAESKRPNDMWVFPAFNC